MTPYEAVPPDAPLTQGDVVDGCPIFIPDAADTPDDPRDPQRYPLGASF